jgi:hypothetical protein
MIGIRSELLQEDYGLVMKATMAVNCKFQASDVILKIIQDRQRFSSVIFDLEQRLELNKRRSSHETHPTTVVSQDRNGSEPPISNPIHKITESFRALSSESLSSTRSKFQSFLNQVSPPSSIKSGPPVQESPLNPLGSRE